MIWLILVIFEEIDDNATHILNNMMIWCFPGIEQIILLFMYSTSFICNFENFTSIIIATTIFCRFY